MKKLINAFTEIMLYECHRIHNYTTKRSQMHFIMTFLPTQCSFQVADCYVVSMCVSLLFQRLRQSKGKGIMIYVVCRT